MVSWFFFLGPNPEISIQIVVRIFENVIPVS